MQLQQLLEAMIAYMGGDARRIQHFIKVHALAQLIGRQEQLNERTQFILEAAALTHDIGIKNGEAKFGAGKCSGKTQRTGVWTGRTLFGIRKKWSECGHLE